MMAWVVRRRDVLGAGALGTAVVGLGSLPQLASTSNRTVTLVEESGVPESRQFASALVDSGFAGKVIHIDRSLNGLLEELETTSGIVIGLTSDPAAMIAGQLLGERGASPQHLWQHHYAGGRWRHQTEGAPRLIEATTYAWPVAIAQQLQSVISGKPAQVSTTCNSGICGLLASSPGMLVSWVFEFKGHQS
jgi:hypothetical protein